MSFQELSDRLNAEKQMEIVKRKEKTESHLYMIVRILYEDNFYGHQGNDLYESDKVTYQEVRVKKQVISLLKLHNVIALSAFFSKTAPRIFMKLCM